MVLREHSTAFALRWALLILVLLGLLLSGRAASAAPQDCPGSEPSLVTALDLRQPHTLPEPAPRTSFRDPAFGRCVTRVTDRAADVESGDPSRGIKNEYSRVQAWNADESLFLLRGLAGTWYVWDASTLRKVRKLPDEVVTEPRWDATDPHLLWAIDGTRLLRVDVTSGAVTTKRDFAGDFPGRTLTFVWTRWEGSPSADGRTWGLMAEDENYEAFAFLVYDLAADRILATRDVSAWPAARASDSVTISPSGRFFLAQCEPCPEGTLGSDASPCGLMVWNADLKNGRGLVRIIGHGDVAYDASGREVFVYQDVETDEIAYVESRDGGADASPGDRLLADPHRSPLLRTIPSPPGVGRRLDVRRDTDLRGVDGRLRLPRGAEAGRGRRPPRAHAFARGSVDGAGLLGRAPRDGES